MTVCCGVTTSSVIALGFLPTLYQTNPVLSLGHFASFTGYMAASAEHSFTSFRSQAMHPPSPVQGLRQKAAIGAVETMEEHNARA